MIIPKDPVQEQDSIHEDEEWDYLSKEIERRKAEREEQLKNNSSFDPGY